MKKQNTLAFLVRNLDSWPTKIKSAPVVDGYRWIRGGSDLFLFDDCAVTGNMQDMKITLHDWKAACLDSATERTVVEAKQDAIAKSLIDGIKSGDIDIQPVINAINKESSVIEVNNLSQEHLLEKVSNLTSHEKAVIVVAWDTHKSITDIERRKDITDTKPNDQVKNPSHYQIIEGFESITIIASALTVEQWKGFCIGNILKYRIRAGKKGDLKQDIDKADFYEELYEQHKHLCKV
jgi:hypothetical protein